MVRPIRISSRTTHVKKEKGASPLWAWPKCGGGRWAVARWQAGAAHLAAVVGGLLGCPLEPSVAAAAAAASSPEQRRRRPVCGAVGEDAGSVADPAAGRGGSAA